ncbi:hypothetical protein BJX64DRAFT_274272 [Aspergillus heterothallicus]
MIPTGKEPRCPGPLGGPHTMFDGSFIIEFLQPPAELDASVLLRATYRGGHEATKLGKQHPQSPPLHIHFYQFESFLVEQGALGTTTTYEMVDTVHTTTGNHTNWLSRRVNTSLPRRNIHGVTVIPPWTPHNFWPVPPDHPFWSTPSGQEYEQCLPAGRNTDTTFLLWGHPRTSPAEFSVAGKRLTTSFPPDMDAAFFLALLDIVDAVHGQRITMSLGLGAVLMMMQTASDSCLVFAPRAWWLGSLRWRIPWAGQVTMEFFRRLFDQRGARQIVGDVISQRVLKGE